MFKKYEGYQLQSRNSGCEKTRKIKSNMIIMTGSNIRA